MSLPVIAIIGRPNVGKSTLFNRLVGERYAVTSPKAGTTRDRIYYETELGGYRTILVDTGGMEFEKKHDIEADIQMQARIAASDANIIFFTIDASQPLTSTDFEAAKFLRKSKKPVVLIANKTDNRKSDIFLSESYKFGLGEPISVSSIHNLGIQELEDATSKILKKLKWKKERAKKNTSISLAVAGKPNVGKSSFVNALLGEDRLIVSAKPGTTIDATDTPFKHNEQNFILIDTAGLRRRGKIAQGIEHYGVLRSLKAISNSDVVCLMLDYGTGLTNQDLHVSEYVLDAGKGLIIAVNKSDLMKDAQIEQKKFFNLLSYRMNYMPWAPVTFISAVKKKNIFRILESAKNIMEERRKWVADDVFKIFVKATVDSHPPMRSGQLITISGGKQTGVCPPSFTFYTNKPDSIHFSYRRFLENEIRRKFGFYGTVIKIGFKSNYT